MKILNIIILVALTTVTATAQQHQHTEHLEVLITEYMKMKNALVDDSFEDATHYLQTFSEEVATSRDMKNHPDHSKKHHTHYNAMLAAVGQASNADNIDQFRQSFEKISTELLKAVKNQGYADQKLYVQYCPMANGKGGQWLSKQKEILNPYFGAAMLNCGETLETLH